MNYFIGRNWNLKSSFLNTVIKMIVIKIQDISFQVDVNTFSLFLQIIRWTFLVKFGGDGGNRECVALLQTMVSNLSKIKCKEGFRENVSLDAEVQNFNISI